MISIAANPYSVLMAYLYSTRSRSPFENTCAWYRLPLTCLMMLPENSGGLAVVSAATAETGNDGRKSRMDERNHWTKQPIPIRLVEPLELLLTLNDGGDVDRMAQCFRTEAGIVRDLVGRSITFRSRQGKLFHQSAVRLYRHHSNLSRTGLRVPNNQLIRARGNLLDREVPFRIGQSIVGVIHRHCPAFHEGMETALHIECAPSFVQIDWTDQRFSRRMVMYRVQVSTPVFVIHDEGRVKEHTGARLQRSLVSLNIMHDRIHINDFDSMAVTHYSHEGL